MRLLLIRHAIAAPLGGKIVRDADRPLTAQGRRRFLRVAAGLVRVAPRPRAILTSPLLRARRTAELAAQAWGELRPHVVPALAEGDEVGIRHALAAFADTDAIVLVGHEPWLSRLTGRLLGSRSGRGFRFRKGGVALIEVDPTEPDHGTLLWFIPPRVFRCL
jgi:phosphohistidine phosphatase